MSTEEREAWILRLQEGGSAFPFDSLSWEQQRTLVTSMASQLVSCWMAMCSLGSPPAVSASTLERLIERLPKEGESTTIASSDGADYEHADAQV